MTSYGGFDHLWTQEPLDSIERSPPKHTLIARLEHSHGVSDVNSIVWCPRRGYEDLLSTVGDDGLLKVWKVVPV
jgi:cytosolic iron-sulfur protein assembly protein CIAO1